MLYSSHIFTDFFPKMFTDVKYSDLGSNACIVEEQAYMYFVDLLEECEDMFHSEVCGHISWGHVSFTKIRPGFIHQIGTCFIHRNGDMFHSEKCGHISFTKMGPCFNSRIGAMFHVSFTEMGPCFNSRIGAVFHVSFTEMGTCFIQRNAATFHSKKWSHVSFTEMVPPFIPRKRGMT